MSVVKVWGKLNNSSKINFANMGGDVWEVTVAVNTPDGRYIAEVWAEDDGGNVSYTMAVVEVVAGKVTCLRFIDNKYSCRYICPKNCVGEITMAGKKYIKFLLGEKRPLEFEAYTADGSDFVIDSATYTLYQYAKPFVTKEGYELKDVPMAIDGHIMSFIFEPEMRGYYVLDVEYTVGSYVEIQRYDINVD